MERVKVGVLGATGAVGQMFVRLLEGHPWFELTEVAASGRSAGQRYADVVSWKQETPLPAAARDLVVKPCEPDLDCQIVFSGLAAEVAGPIEQAFARAGYLVLSNARNHRMDADVPLVIPELNPDHLQLIPRQRRERGWSGAIVTNSNCSTMFLALALGPLDRAFGVERVLVTTLQAVSGAGYPGLPSLDILGNVIPYIGGEEEKIETESRKILGRLEGDRICPAPFTVSAQVNRVPVLDGHTECLSVAFRRPPTPAEAIEALRSFRGLPQERGYPSAPSAPVLVLAEQDRPQPRLDVWRERGMAALVGRVRPCPVLDLKFVVLGHNTVRGAAGASILNAELMLDQGWL